jgi:3-dehydroquinate dehydratase-2
MMKKLHKILIANGVNLDLLGTRETSIYGAENLKSLENQILDFKSKLEKIYFCDIELEFFQTNEEFSLLQKVSENFDGIVLNPAAWTHTSLALADRLKSIETPYIETHLSNIHDREEYRKHSYTAPKASGVIHGLGFTSYKAALLALVDIID